MGLTTYLYINVIALMTFIGLFMKGQHIPRGDQEYKLTIYIVLSVICIGIFMYTFWIIMFTISN